MRCFQAQDMNRQLEEKLKLREAEIYRLRDSTRTLKDLNSNSSLSRHSKASSVEVSDELKNILEDKEHEIAV